jgi:enoyl-CoA hydratase
MIKTFPAEDRAAEEIRFERIGRLGLVTLDRPRALNALTLGMIRRLDPMLAGWAHDHAVDAVAIRGAGPKAFCAGGDVRAVYEAGRRGTDVLTYEFFFEEYRLNRRIHRYAKPYLALIDGIAMGGGLGLSVHGRYRVVTERASVAMPETAIGLFPDVGGSWFLDRAPGQIGLYLALTGARLTGADVLHAGLGTHFVPSGDLPALLDALQRVSPEAALRRFAVDPGPAPLAALQLRIDRCFAPPTIEGILEALEEEGEWGRGIAADLARKSPTSLKATLRLLRVTHRHDIEFCLRTEFRLVQRIMAGHDFYEGIRALLVDKDHAPRWRPSDLADVSDGEIDALFAPLASGELTFAD